MSRSSLAVIHHAVLSFLISLIILFALIIPGRANQKITACGHHDYAPWNWKSGDSIIGACAEITQELFRRVGVETDLKFVGP
ncbi:MAG: hypothetical protein QNK24_09700, partial [Desulfuromusa sp.]|nr:hypothetical protein [Desulfuromusa sp.]